MEEKRQKNPERFCFWSSFFFLKWKLESLCSSYLFLSFLGRISFIILFTAAAKTKERRAIWVITRKRKEKAVSSFVRRRFLAKKRGGGGGKFISKELIMSWFFGDDLGKRSSNKKRPLFRGLPFWQNGWVNYGFPFCAWSTFVTFFFVRSSSSSSRFVWKREEKETF